MLEIKREKVGKNDKIYDIVAIVNGKGKVVAGSSFACEIDADAAVAMIEALLGYEAYPCVTYEEMRNNYDICFKKLADGKDPFTFDKDYVMDRQQLIDKVIELRKFADEVLAEVQSER